MALLMQVILFFKRSGHEQAGLTCLFISLFVASL